MVASAPDPALPATTISSSSCALGEGSELGVVVIAPSGSEIPLGGVEKIGSSVLDIGRSLGWHVFSASGVRQADL